MILFILLCILLLVSVLLITYNNIGKLKTLLKSNILKRKFVNNKILKHTSDVITRMSLGELQVYNIYMNIIKDENYYVNISKLMQNNYVIPKSEVSVYGYKSLSFSEVYDEMKACSKFGFGSNFSIDYNIDITKTIKMKIWDVVMNIPIKDYVSEQYYVFINSENNVILSQHIPVWDFQLNYWKYDAHNNWYINIGHINNNIPDKDKLRSLFKICGGNIICNYTWKAEHTNNININNSDIIWNADYYINNISITNIKDDTTNVQHLLYNNITRISIYKNGIIRDIDGDIVGYILGYDWKNRSFPIIKD